MKQFLEIGEIVGTHGIKGEIRVYPWADSPDFLCDFKTLYFDENGGNGVNIKSAKVHKNIVIMRLDGVNDVDSAALLRGKILFMDRNDAHLDEDVYFVQDLIGLAVLDVDTNEKYGTLSDVSKTGANDVYHIKSDDGKETLIAAVPSVVIVTDIEGGTMKIRPLKGTFDED